MLRMCSVIYLNILSFYEVKDCSYFGWVKKVFDLQ